MNDHDLDLDAKLRAKYTDRARGDASPQLASRVLAIPANSPTGHGRLPWRLPGGTHLMFSATKMVATVAIVALSGAFLVNGLGGSTGPSPVPGATTVDLDLSPSHVDGTVTPMDESDLEATSLGDSMFEWTDPSQMAWQSNDPRLSGQGTAVEHGVQHYSTYTGLRSTSWTIDNDDGSWTGTASGYSREDGGQDFIVLTGSGSYAGLSAYVALGQETSDFDGSPRPFEGVIFPGAPPAFPE